MTIDKNNLSGEYHADVAALLAEIEQLTKQVDNLVDLNLSERRDAEALQAQRDQLKAENDHLKSGLAIVRVFTDAGDSLLMPHLEALRKDAERYRWICDGNGYFLEHAGIAGHGNEKAQADQAIDAAMAKEASRG